MRSASTPYTNFKFRVKWDGRYVAGISKCSALKRSTEVIEHREGGDPSTLAQVAGPQQVRGHHARARRHAGPRVRALGEQGVELRRRARPGDLAQGLPQGHHPRAVQRGRPAGARLQDLSLLGVRVPGAAGSRRQRERRRDPVASSSRTKAGSATSTWPSRRSPASPSRRSKGAHAAAGCAIPARVLGARPSAPSARPRAAAVCGRRAAGRPGDARRSAARRAQCGVAETAPIAVRRRA